jgi:hypothetical protein
MYDSFRAFSTQVCASAYSRMNLHDINNAGRSKLDIDWGRMKVVDDIASASGPAAGAMHACRDTLAWFPHLCVSFTCIVICRIKRNGLQKKVA